MTFDKKKQYIIKTFLLLTGNEEALELKSEDVHLLRGAFNFSCSNFLSENSSYPDFVLGFDLVGQEDLGRPLIEFITEILAGLEQNPGLRVFFHAGETDWQGSSTDLVSIPNVLLF